MLKYLLACCLGLLLAVSTLAEELKLGTPLEAQLTPPNKVEYTLALSDTDIPKDQDLFFVARGETEDPYDTPDLEITKGTEKWHCNKRVKADACVVPKESIHPGDKFQVKVSCVDDCKFKVQAYFSPHHRLELDHPIDVGFSLQKPVFLTVLEIPKNLPSYDQIAIQAIVKKESDVDYGFYLGANIGDTVKMPTGSFEYEGTNIWDDGKAIYFNEAKPGEYVTIELSSSPGMILSLKSYARSHNKTSLKLGMIMRDEIPSNASRMYVIEKPNWPKNASLVINVMKYEGKPIIQVSPHQNMPDAKVLQGNLGQSMSQIYISPQIREDMGYQDAVYVQIKSPSESVYSLIAYVDDKNYRSLGEDQIEMSQLDGNEVDNYMYTVWQSQQDVKDVTVKVTVDAFVGDVEFAVRRCKSLETGQPVSSCVYDNQNDVVANSKDFSEIMGHYEVYRNIGEFTFTYPLDQCTASVDNKTRICVFQIVCFKLQNNVNVSEYQIQARRVNNGIENLYEARPRRQRIQKDQYHFFVFKPKNLQEIKEVRFILTPISGDCAVIGSTKQEAITFESDSKYEIGANNVIVYKGDKIRDKYYISVKAFEISYYSLTVHIKRKHPEEPHHETLLLREGIAQSYSPQKDEYEVYFKISLDEEKSFRVKIQSKTTVSFKVYPSTKDSLDKKGPHWLSDKSQCLVAKSIQNPYTSTNEFIVVVSTTPRLWDTSFTIQYIEISQCIRGALSRPIFMHVQPISSKVSVGQRQCIDFVLTKTVPFQIVTTASPVSAVLEKVNVEMTMNNTGGLVKDNVKLVTQEQIKEACPMLIGKTHDNDSRLHQCVLTLQFASASDDGVSFAVAVQYLDEENVLFDGISQTFSSDRISPSMPKHFLYQLSEPKHQVLVSLKSLNKFNFSVYANVVDWRHYMNKSEGIVYPRRQDPKTFKYSSHTTLTGFTTLMISKQALENQQCQKCYLLLSIYTLDQPNNGREVDFMITVSENEIRTYLGETNTGYIVKDMVVSYQAYITRSQEVLVNLNTFGRKCGSLEVSAKREGHPDKLVGSTESNSILVPGFEPEYNRSDYLLSVRFLGNTSCMYQLTLVGITENIHELLLNSPQQIVLKRGDKIYYLFRIGSENDEDMSLLSSSEDGGRSPPAKKDMILIPMMEFGAVVIRAGLVQNHRLRYIQMDIQKKEVSEELFQYYIQSEKEGVLTVDRDNPKFCTNCYMVVQVTAVSQESRLSLLLINSHDNVPVIENKLIREVTDTAEERTYIHHSLTGFNISIDILYGAVDLEVIKSRNTSVYLAENITAKEIFPIPHPKQEQNRIFELYQIESEYTIHIRTKKQASYTLEVSTAKAKFRIRQGLPFQLLLDPSKQQVCVEYLSGTSSHSAHLIVQTPNASLVSYTLNCVKEHKNDTCPSKLVLDQLRSQENINLEVVSEEGTYVFCLKSQKTINVTLLLSRQHMTNFIRHNSQNMIQMKGDTDQYFTLYNPKNSNVMLEVFECTDTPLTVQINSDYDELMANKSELVTEHSKRAGHYITYTQTKQGEYFLKASSPAGDNKFIFKYSFYTGDEMPYSKLYAENDDYFIRYSLNNGVASFEVKKVQAKESTINFVQHQYVLYLTEDLSSARSTSQCEIGTTFNQTLQFGDNPIYTPDIVRFQVKLQDLPENLKNSPTMYATIVCNLEAFPSRELSSDYYRVIYDTVQVSSYASWMGINQSGSNYGQLFMFVILPGLAGIAILAASIRYCILKLQEINRKNSFGEESEEPPVQTTGDALHAVNKRGEV